jgi:hypothetical protein
VNNAHNAETRQHATWQVLLLVGKVNIDDPGNAEVFFRRALKEAETGHGFESPEAGLCLIELSDLLEHQGKLVEAEPLSRRYREILARLAQKLGLDY